MGRGGVEIVMTWGHMKLAVNTLQTEKQEEEQMSHDDFFNLGFRSLLQAGVMIAIYCQSWHSVILFAHHISVPLLVLCHSLLITARTSTIDWPELGGLCKVTASHCTTLPLYNCTHTREMLHDLCTINLTSEILPRAFHSPLFIIRAWTSKAFFVS